MRKLFNLLLFLFIFVNANAYYAIDLCMRDTQSSSHGSNAVPIGKHLAMVYCEYDDKTNKLIKVIDSRGYFMEGSFPEGNPEDVCKKISNGAYNCNFKSKGTNKEEMNNLWGKVIYVYNKHSSKDYSISYHNCGTVANKACKKIGVSGVPLSTNMGCGLYSECFNFNGANNSNSINNSSEECGGENFNDLVYKFLDSYI